jgi:hypothetical protein
MRMLPSLTAFLLAILLIPAPAQSPPAAKQSANSALLVGAWEGRDRDADGMSLTFTFGPKGTLETTRGVITNFQGHPEGNDLVTQIFSAAGKPQAVHIHAAGDNLTYVAEEGFPQEWIRLGSAVAGAPAWVGAWAFDHLGTAPGKKQGKTKIRGGGTIQELMRESMRMLITPDGKGRLRFPVDSNIGAYAVQPGRLILQYSGRSLFMNWRLDGNTLYLLGENAKVESAYDRVQ